MKIDKFQNLTGFHHRKLQGEVLKKMKKYDKIKESRTFFGNFGSCAAKPGEMLCKTKLLSPVTALAISAPS